MAFRSDLDPISFPKKHKKHKKDRHESGSDRLSSLKLILKVGSSSTPEHSDSPGPVFQPQSYLVAGDDESIHSSSSFHKKSKKKKKKKDRDRDKHEKKKKHHHKEKKRRTYESSIDGVSTGEDSLHEYWKTPSHNLIEGFESVLGDKHEAFVKKDVLGESSANRKPRLCVQLLRQKQSRTFLQKLLDYLHRQLEKKDPQKVFAMPVTDYIAPNYSSTISHPMDFSTMRQKIEDNIYPSLNAYINDFKLMCNNAMVYNLPETVFYKAAKRLLHAGLKIMSPEKVTLLIPTLPFISQIPKEQLGFYVPGGYIQDDIIDVCSPQNIDDYDESSNSKDSLKRKTYLIDNSFDDFSDGLSPEEILKQAQGAAQQAAEKLAAKNVKTDLGFLRRNPDGTTSLAILVPSTEDDSEEMTLGQLTGKLSHGSGILQSFREDKKVLGKPVKPLNNGAFCSYAPSYDSAFANLSKEETEFVNETYGDENATKYAESILNFARGCDYTLSMVENLLDLLTGGEHRKTKKMLDEQRKFREEEERIKELMEIKTEIPTISPMPPQPVNKPDLSIVKVEIDELKSLSDLGIDTSFLNEIDSSVVEPSINEKLVHNNMLVDKLHHIQNERLSAPLPHLSHILPPNPLETQIAHKITDNLTDLVKHVPPSAIASISAIRKVMGVMPETATASTNTACVLPTPHVDRSVLDADESNVGDESCVGVGQLDLESELREFLESDSALSSFPLHDDKTIEEMLSES